MTLHLIELPLSLKSLHQWARERGLGSSAEEGTILHHLLGETFGPAAVQPFRLLVAKGAQTGTVYGYSTADAETLRARASTYLTPSQAMVIELSRLRSISRPPTAWFAGQRIGFDLRLRPVVRLASDLSGKNERGAVVLLRKGAEIDAYLASVLRGRTMTRETAYLDWLASRLADAAELDLATTRLASFQRNRVQRNGQLIEGPDAVMHGTLKVINPSAFALLLARGVGRHRCYGYGMLLLRPPQRVAHASGAEHRMRQSPADT